MIRALGYSHNDFDPSSPGRLCRGRERWIEPYEIDDTDRVQRLVISGAAFTDDSAADAQRGVVHSGVDLAAVIQAIFPRRELVAFMEDGHPADIPEDAEGVELYTGHRNGGRSEELMVRWFKTVSGVREIRQLLGSPEEPKVLGFAWLQPGVQVDDDVRQRFFQLVGLGCLDSPPARFQPAALPEVLEVCRAVALIHRDKHGPALGVYSTDPMSAEDRVVSLCHDSDSLPVRFAIPPMLARWDRALSEARAEWIETREDEFPVPVAPESSRWEPRRGRRRRGERASLAQEAEAAAEQAQAAANEE